MISFFANAQLCTGTLGDPIVNVTFGSGHHRLPPSATSYTFTDGCPGKEEYTINNFLFGCGRTNEAPYGTWLAMVYDHTPNDSDGDYMMVNAESTPGLVLVDTATGLCANITYQYAAYIANTMRLPWTCGGKPILPNLTFRIEKLDGTLLASYNTGDIPIAEQEKWTQYGFSYINPPGTDAVILKIMANAPWGCGNGFALDDVTFQQCSPVTVNLTVNGKKDPINVCADYKDTFVLKGTYTSGLRDPVVLWQKSIDSAKTWIDIPGDTTISYTMPHRTSGIILYRMIVADRENINSPHCRIPSNIIYTEIHPVPEHIPPQNVIGCVGQDFPLPAINPHALTILWTSSNGYSSNDPRAVIKNFQYGDTGLYKLNEYFNFGCFSLDTFYITGAQGINIYAQAATPLCEGQTETLHASASMEGSYKWTPPTALSNDAIPDPDASPKEYTYYKVIVTNTSGCKDSALVTINVYKIPIAQAGADKAIVLGDTAILKGIVAGDAVSCYWSPSIFMSDSHALNPSVYPQQEVTYTLNVVSSLGCGTASDDVKITVYNDIYIPNSFTPNGDGKNDRFRLLPYADYTVNKFLIYNRWGRVIFETKDATKGWDGTQNGIPASMGTYVYFLELQNSKQQKIIKKGTVLLLR